MGWNLRIAGSLGLIVLATAFSTGRAYAKTPGYVLSAGDLGSFAIGFFTDDYIEHPNADAEEVANPLTGQEAPYLIYSDRPFVAAEEIASLNPEALLYPAKHLAYNPATNTWLHLSDRLWFGQESWSGVQKAIDKAHAGISHTTLADGPVLAAFRARGYDTGIYRVTDTADGSGFQMLGQDFPLKELSAAVSSPVTYATNADGDLVYRVEAAPSEVAPHTLLYYAPPTSFRPGLIWSSETMGSAEQRWLSTQDFDVAFASAVHIPLNVAPAIYLLHLGSQASGQGDERARLSSNAHRVERLAILPAVVIVLAGCLSTMRLVRRRSG